MMCPACHGNGYVAGAPRPGLPGAPWQVRQCRNCESRGEIEDAEGNSIEEGVNKRLQLLASALLKMQLDPPPRPQPTKETPR